jgi:hypothetical protein
MDHDHVKALELEIATLRSRLQPHDTGHLHTAINVLEDRICEILDLDVKEWRELCKTRAQVR